jgi:hypothetical protein
VLSEAKKRADHELAGLDVLDLAADRLDNPGVLVTHRRGSLDGFDSPVGPQVRTAYAGGGQADDGIGGFDDLRVGALFDAHVMGGVQDGSSHEMFLPSL